MELKKLTKLNPIIIINVNLALESLNFFIKQGSIFMIVMTIQCKLVVSIKKWVDINEYKYVCINWCTLAGKIDNMHCSNI